MSKIGRKPIALSVATVQMSGRTVQINGPKLKVTHELPEELVLTQDGKALTLSIKENNRKNRMLWGLHRALLANKVQGVEKGFQQVVKIVGLGFKAQQAGKKLVFSLGYSHKIDYTLPENVDVEVDKTGQILILKSADKFSLGNACDAIRSLRPPEPYKGTGIQLEGEVIIRKAGKTKAA